MQKTFVTVLSFKDSVQARLAKDRLASVGIPARLDGDTPPAIKLKVFEEDLERDRELLARPAETLLDEDEEEDEKEIDPTRRKHWRRERGGRPSMAWPFCRSSCTSIPFG